MRHLPPMPDRPSETYGPFLESLRGVTWPARHTVSSGAAGAHHSRLRGYAPEFTEYRAYRQGDDPRRLDWKLLARTDRPYFRLSTDRVTLDTLIVVDTSASMRFPVDTEAKWRQACRVAVGLAAVAHAGGDPVGLALSGATGGVSPRTRRGVVAQIANVLDDARPARAADVASFLSSAPKATRIAVVSDFLEDTDELLDAIRRLVATGHEVHGVHVMAREELEPERAAFLATDPERPELRRPFVEDARAAYDEAFAAWRRRLAAAWRAAGAHYTEILTDEDAARAVRRVAAPAA